MLRKISVIKFTPSSLASIVGSREHTISTSWARTTMRELVGGVGKWLFEAGWSRAFGKAGKKEESDWPGKQ